MATVPTNQMERELRKLYLQWLAGLSRQSDVGAYIDQFEKDSVLLISRLGGQAASLGALADFPVPKTLALSPVAGVVYNEMKQAAISASITAGLNSREAARAMLNAGLDKSYKRLERLARTETVSAYWKNQWDSTADLPLLVMVWGSEESKRTCDFCLSRDGLVVEDSNIRDHPNGRCTLIPTLRSAVKYKGTLQADGSVTQDPRWAAKTKEVMNPVVDPLIKPPAKIVQPATKTQVLTDAQKLANARTMYGTGSKEYQTALAKWGKPAAKTPVKALAKTGNPRADAINLIVQRQNVSLAEAVRIYNAGKAPAVKKAAVTVKKATTVPLKNSIKTSSKTAPATPRIDKLKKLSVTPRNLTKTVENGAANPNNARWARRRGVALTEAQAAALRDYQINCTRVSATVEMRRRGFDVKAAPAGKTADKSIGWVEANWYDPATGAAPAMSRVNSATQLTTQMALAPDGARFLVVGPWQGGGAHIWNAEKIKGKVVFIEGQGYNGSGQDVTRKYMANLDFDTWAGTPSSVSYMRVDNLLPTDRITRSFE